LDKIDITFELNPLDDTVAKEKLPTWFRLTDGTFDVSVGSGSIYRAKSDGVHYYVARLWEDLIAVEPYALEPIPTPIEALIEDVQRWAATIDDLMDRSPGEMRPGRALAWWSNRLVDSSYLSRGPELAFVRVDSEVRIIRSVPGDEASVVAVKAGQFADEMSSFDGRLVAAMAARLDELAESRLLHPPMLEQIRLDHEGRARDRSTTMLHHVPTDWSAVLLALKQLKVL
jgi:hypothetical protein